jgi:tripartite-type tricarboxylate transporter receptor subunit TctC
MGQQYCVRPSLCAALAAGALSVALPAIAADSYPSKPVRFIVGFAPGGATDIVARLLSGRMAEALGQQVVVDNRASGGGIVGAAITARAQPDGYTVLMSSISALATSVSMYAKLPYDPFRDLAPITLAAVTPYLLTVQASLPADTAKEFVALAKAKPGQLNYGSSGTGGGAHLAFELFRTMAGVNIVHVPYKGAAPALVDLMGGHIQLTFSQPPVAWPYLKGGRIKAIAITSARRSAVLPEVPTLAESGLTDYEATSWQGVVAPAGTPQPIVARLNSVIAQALRSPEVGERLAAEGAEPGGNTAEEFAAFIAREIAKWATVVKQSGLKAD